MKAIQVALAGLVLLSAGVCLADVLHGPVVNPGNGHAYYLLTENNWTGSETEAVSLGGYLATINDAAENQWVYDTFSSFGGVPRSLWIGLNDAASEGTFVWVNGEAALYRNWGPGEPNNSGGNEDWVHIFSPQDSRSPRWNDAPDQVNPFGLTNGVAEVGGTPPPPPPPPPPLPDVLHGPVVNPTNGHAYYLLAQDNWTNSEAKAVALGGHLATINDAAENQWVFDTFSSFDGVNRLMWIGLSDTAEPGTYRWVNGEPVSYLNWDQMEPSDPNEHWALMYPSGVSGVGGRERLPGKWNDFRDVDSDIGVGLFGVVELVPIPEPATAILLLSRRSCSA